MSVLIVDYGSQYTQLISRRLSELGVESSIISWDKVTDDLSPSAVILSGGPAVVTDCNAPKLNMRILGFGAPVLGVCYGMQLLATALGGSVCVTGNGEYGRASVKALQKSKLLEGIDDKFEAWMSHGVSVSQVPVGFKVDALSETGLYAAISNDDAYFYGVQFHPEVSHTQIGGKILSNFLKIAGIPSRKNLHTKLSTTEIELRKQLGSTSKVLCGVSGGVDSTVVARLLHNAIGDRLTCIFVDTGLLRQNEVEDTMGMFSDYGIKVRCYDASEQFLQTLKGITDPESKRKIIGGEFVKAFLRAVGDEKFDFLAQGTLYPDVIESMSTKGPSSVIKSHHNVGGLPKELNLRVCEPLRFMFKDEVRELGKELGIPDKMLWRQPFPGPGLAIRIVGEVTPQRVAAVRKANHIVSEVMEQEYSTDVSRKFWQYFAVYAPVKSVGVVGDERTYGDTIVVRICDSLDGMTANWSRIDYNILDQISTRITNEVDGISRVVYDISHKPPATIEWE